MYLLWGFISLFSGEIYLLILQGVPLATECGICLIILTPMKILGRNLNRSTFVVWEMKRGVYVVRLILATRSSGPPASRVRWRVGQTVPYRFVWRFAVSSHFGIFKWKLNSCISVLTSCTGGWRLANWKWNRRKVTVYLLTYSMEQSPSWEANWFCS